MLVKHHCVALRFYSRVLRLSFSQRNVDNYRYLESFSAVLTYIRRKNTKNGKRELKMIISLSNSLIKKITYNMLFCLLMDYVKIVNRSVTYNLWTAEISIIVLSCCFCKQFTICMVLNNLCGLVFKFSTD